jgi:hypothetical protein
VKEEEEKEEKDEKKELKEELRREKRGNRQCKSTYRSLQISTESVESIWGRTDRPTDR